MIRGLALLAPLALAACVDMPGAGSPQLSQVGPPLDPPPATFEGDRFVDQRGCIYLRVQGAGQGWAPLATPDRRAVCDGTPTVPATAEDVPGPATVI